MVYISYTVLKNIVDEILVPLEHIFNLSLVKLMVLFQEKLKLLRLFLFSKQVTLQF